SIFATPTVGSVTAARSTKRAFQTSRLPASRSRSSAARRECERDRAKCSRATTCASLKRARRSTRPIRQRCGFASSKAKRFRSMTHHREKLTIETRGRGTYDVTDRVQRAVAASRIQEGLCNVFVHHTSASLIICENADAVVRADLERFVAR